MPLGLDHGAGNSEMLAHHAGLPVAQLLVDLGLWAAVASATPGEKHGKRLRLIGLDQAELLADYHY